MKEFCQEQYMTSPMRSLNTTNTFFSKINRCSLMQNTEQNLQTLTWQQSQFCPHSMHTMEIWGLGNSTPYIPSSYWFLVPSHEKVLFSRSCGVWTIAHTAPVWREGCHGCAFEGKLWIRLSSSGDKNVGSMWLAGQMQCEMFGLPAQICGFPSLSLAAACWLWIFAVLFSKRKFKGYMMPIKINSDTSSGTAPKLT